jgi:putative serine protease PepD
MHHKALRWILIVAIGLLVSPAQARGACNKPPSEVFETVAPSVVRIFSIAIDPFSLAERVQINVGSGLVIDNLGHVVTNAHIVHAAREIMIAPDDEAMREASLVGIDAISDLAVLRMAGSSIGLKPAPLGGSSDMRVGDEVLAIGYPFGFGKTATRGIVSGIGRYLPLTPMSWLTPLIQTDAAINPGNSGGPLVNLCGEILGINTLAGGQGQSINFAVSVDLLREIVPQLLQHGRVIRAWHGIHGQLVPPVLIFTMGIPPGFLIETIEPGSPAQQVGLRGGTFPIMIGVEEYLIGGDVILRVNGEALSNMDTVRRIATELKVGDTLKIDYYRDGTILSAEVTLPERPALPGDVRRFRHYRGHGRL